MSETKGQTAPLDNYMPSKTKSSASSRKLNPIEDVQSYAVEFAKEQPQTAALWCFGIGFLAGWKLKPW